MRVQFANGTTTRQIVAKTKRPATTVAQALQRARGYIYVPYLSGLVLMNG